MSALFQSFQNAIIQGQLTSTEMAQLVRLMNRKVANDNRRAFRVGDKVEFRAPNGRSGSGTVVKINPKYIVVENGYMRWNVHPSIMTKLGDMTPNKWEV